MRNTKDNLVLIKHHKNCVSEIKIQINKLEGELALHNRVIKELDMVRQNHKKKIRFRKNVADMVRKQDLVVTALRTIGKPVSASDICNELKNLGFHCHNSEFATKFLAYVQEDKRVVIKKINASKNIYALREWGLELVD